MSVLNRENQKIILERLQETYSGAGLMPDALRIEGALPFADIFYLREHGLITFKFGGYVGRDLHPKISSQIQITKDGMDFLEDDGGLSAILGVVTIRLHDDTIKSLIETKIVQSDLAPEDKKKYVDQLRSLPADATKRLVLRLLDKGLEGGPAAIAWLGTCLSQIPLG